MNQCVQINFLGVFSHKGLREFILKTARGFGLEGTGQSIDKGKIKITICGKRDKIQEFIDELHAQADEHAMSNIEIEPFFKQKEFRGIFRIIE